MLENLTKMTACLRILLIVYLMLLNFLGIKIIEATSKLQPTAIQHSLPKISTKGESSICTTNGTDYVLFSDQSQLDGANKKRQQTETAYVKVSMGFCQTQCNLICPIVSQPICALDETTATQRSFNNLCEMSRDACLNNIPWKLQSTGSCSTLQKPSKPYFDSNVKSNAGKRKAVPCLNVFNPVCAIFAGVKSTFNNECLVNAENVKTGNDWTIFSHGVCAEDYASYSSKSDPLKYNKIRSYDKDIYHDKQQPIERYFDDTTFIYTPPIIQTEYVDETIFPDKFHNPTTLYHQLKLQQPSNAQTIHAQRPTIANHNHHDLDRVQLCKYGSDPVCGTYKKSYRTFDNICELIWRNYLLNQTWTYVHADNCIKSNCRQKCSKEYAPICVSRDGVNITIANSCYLELQKCQDPRSTWKILTKGECKEGIIWPPIGNIAKAVRLDSIRKFKPNAFASRIETKHQTTTASPVSSTSTEVVTSTITPTPTEIIFVILPKKAKTREESAITDETATSEEVATRKEAETRDAAATREAELTTIASLTTITTTTKDSTTTITAATATTEAPPTTPKSTTTAATPTSKSIASFTFDKQKSIATPKQYVSLTTTEATKATTPITLSPYKSTTKAPISTFVISAKIAPASSSRTSIYGPNRNSVIMRLVKAKAHASPKYTLARAFSKPSSL